jgi:CubicO group peptidase (beta-lactamase class C family)
MGHTYVVDLDALTAEWVSAERLPSLGVAVVRHGEPARLAHAGGQVGRDSTWRIGSVSKAITAIGVMQLVEHGTVDLDAPLERSLRSLRVEGPDAEAITIRHILAHTAGFGVLRRVTDLGRPMAGMAGRKPPKSLVEYYGGVVRTDFKPGEAWIYSNHGYAVLGQIVEDVTQTDFADHMRAAVLAPLGMQDSDYAPSDRLLAALVPGFQRRGESLARTAMRHMLLPPAGSVLSTTGDLARLVEGLLAGGGVLAPATLAEMLRPHHQLHPVLVGMGLGFALHRFDGLQIAMHNGAWEGFAAHLAFVPDAGVGVAMVTNVRTTVLDRLAPALLRRLLGVGDPESLLRPGPPHGRNVDAFTGIYRPLPKVRGRRALLSGLPGALEVGTRDGMLTLRTPPRRRAAVLHPANDDPLTFWFEQQGVVQAAVFAVEAGDEIDRLYLGPYRFARRRRRGGLARGARGG